MNIAAPKPKPIPRELPHSDQFVNETEDKEEDDVERDKVHGELPHEEAPGKYVIVVKFDGSVHQVHHLSA